MALGDIDADAIRESISEFLRLGRDRFLDTYGFGRATTYLLEDSGRFFDPKAIVGVAHMYSPIGSPLTVADLDATEAVQRLRRLGFRVLAFSRLWWVNQGKTYDAELAEGIVWAPTQSKSGVQLEHHKAVMQLRPGDMIVHYSKGVRAVSFVASEPLNAPKPASISSDEWQTAGFLCRTDYRTLPDPIPIGEVPNRNADVGPFDRNGDVKQAYLMQVSSQATLPLLEFLVKRIPNLFEKAPDVPERKERSETTVETDPQASKLIGILLEFKNVVLEGVPGTGKSYAIEQIADSWHERAGRQLFETGGQKFRAAVMHPSTSYEDFVEGVRPGDSKASGYFDEPIASSSQSFAVQNGFFVEACIDAITHPDRDVLVLLDEFNRCNVANVMGDLLLALEQSKRGRYSGVGRQREQVQAADWEAAVTVRLPYSGRMLFVPDNVYVLATANTSDRSIAPFDAALRRRFAFERLEPNMPHASDLEERGAEEHLPELLAASRMLESLNESVLRPCIGPDALLGHSYVYAAAETLQADTSHGSADSVLERIWRFAILPQLIDITRSFGAEDVLDLKYRPTWFSNHSELEGSADQAQAVLTEFDSYLRGLGLGLRVEGIGLARGASVTSDFELPIPDLMFNSDQ